MLNYEVAVTTGQEENAGTEANIHITLRGKGGSSGKRLLKKAVNHDNKFEGGQVSTTLNGVPICVEIALHYPSTRIKLHQVDLCKLYIMMSDNENQCVAI